MHEALAAHEALNKISHGDKPIPVRFAYAATRNRRMLAELVQAYEESRQSLLQAHGKRDEAGQLVIVDGNVQLEDTAAFSEAFAAIYMQDFPEVKLHQVALEDFPKDIDMAVMDGLMAMVLEPAEAAKA